ncbi:aminoacyl-tRNA hydrolase [Halobacteria archaeon AArc-curdl1]|uniref:peptidyl-tRNA hydrolase n=1 Tax=Natronosalvus hydrolyticus TaxID=2979988 RepID=A0AAP2ZBE7_9EURY|nr:aminoacyl-tRNA hydrolase [Halobacteria archaeon AArc-curdl1]
MKQAIIVRNDLDISVGKLVAQACHASVLGYKREEKHGANQAQGNEMKVVVHAGGDTLHELADKARTKGIPSQMVRDAGRTEVERGTVTALAIGPADESEVDSLTGHLPLFKSMEKLGNRGEGGSSG